MWVDKKPSNFFDTYGSFYHEDKIDGSSFPNFS